MYAVQQDTQSVLMGKFYSALILARHVSDLIGPSSGAFCTSCICRLWYVVIRVLLDTSSRYVDVSSSTRITTYRSQRIQLVQNAPDDGPMRSETCRANISAEKTYSLNHTMYLVGLYIYYKMIHGPYNVKLTTSFSRKILFQELT